MKYSGYRPSSSTVARGLARTAVLVLVVTGSLLVTSCGEIADDFTSEAVCGDYCNKKFDCEDTVPNSEENDACVGSCRNSIEDNCGNEHQSAANGKISECVDMGCVDFWACMVFDVAPECFEFVP